MERSRTSVPPVPQSAPAAAGLLQRKCACGQHTGGEGECAECKRKKEENKSREGRIQTKLALGSPGDPLELEADRIADLVVGGGLRSSREPIHPIRGNGGETLRRKPEPAPAPSSAAAVPPGSGQPLDGEARAFMEPRFGHDFSRVRIHTDSRAAESARSFGALAYTLGENIVFGPGRYNPATTSGRQLLAHELTHVLQQSGPASTAAPASLKVQALPAPRLQKAAGNPCGQNQVDALQDTAQLASDVVGRAGEKISSFLSAGTTSTSESRQVAQALFRNFNSRDERSAATAKTIAGKLSAIKGKCSSYRFMDIVCQPTDNDGFCPVGPAYVDGEGKTLTLCPAFFATKSPRLKIYMFIHEMAHTTGQEVIDRGYTGQRVYPHLSTEEALRNADSFARFVMELDDNDQIPSEKAFGAFEFPLDRYKGCDKGQEGTIHSALGRAEAWVLNALKVLLDPGLRRNPPPGLERALGRYGLLKTQDVFGRNAAAYRNEYQRGRGLLEKSLASQCQKSDEDCGGKSAVYDGTFHLCPGWFRKREPASVTDLLTAFFSQRDPVVGDLMGGAAVEIAAATLSLDASPSAEKKAESPGVKEQAAPLLASDMTPQQKAEAEKIIQEIKTKYGIDFSSTAGAEAIRKKYENASEKVRNSVKAVSWRLRELQALARALSHFAPILGEGRKGSSRGKVDQELKTVSRVNKTITSNTPFAGLDDKTYGQTLDAAGNVSLLDPVYEHTSKDSTELKPIEAAFTHEMTHALMVYLLPEFISAIGYWPSKRPGAEAPISEYGNASAEEDLAETVMYFFVDPEGLKKGQGEKPGEPGNPCPRRFRFVEQAVRRWGARK